jgi:hypothetical protein
MWAGAGKRQARSGSLVALSVLGLLAASGQSRAEEAVATPVEVYWNHAAVLRVPGVSRAIVLDESVCQAEISEDKIRFVGLARGESVVLVWAGDRRLSLLVRVVAEPAKPPPPTLRGDSGDGSIHGIYGPSLQWATSSQGIPAYVLVQRLSFDQELGSSRLSVQGQVQNQNGAGAPPFNLNTMSVQYSTPGYKLSLADTIVGMNGGFQARLLPNSPFLNSVLLRGAEFQVRRGRNEYGFFAGATVPAYYLDLTATRSVFGFNFGRQQSSRLYLYGTTAGASVPLLEPDGAYRRHADAFQTAGFVFHWNDRWAVQSTGGVSTSGALAQGAVLYSLANRTAYLSVTRASAGFPLNQLQLLPAGRSSLTAGAEQQFNQKVGGGVFYQYSSTQSNALFTSPSASDYLSPYLNLALSDRHRLSVNYTLTRNRGVLGAASQTTGRRADFQLSSQITPWLGNSAEVLTGSLSDPLQISAAAQLSMREAVNFRLFAGGTLFVTFSHDRQDPSLVNRLSGELGILSPALQELFREDPVAFVESPSLAPEIRALLSNLQPTNSQVSLSGQFVFRRRLSVSPQVGYFRAAKGSAEHSTSYTLGYTLAYQLTSRLQLQSSFSNLLLWDSRGQGLRRDTVFGAGCNVALRGSARRLIPYRAHRGAIRGRVYRDLNVNGAFNAGEPGFAGIRVDLSNGQSVLTDSEGRYEFSRLSAGTYRVSLGLAQFHIPVRVTSPTEVSVDLSSGNIAGADFGIVNFARVQGTVFNDYAMDGGRQPDAPPVPGVRLVLTGEGFRGEAVSDGSGDFEFDELSPGDYTLAVDPATFPANFTGRATAYELHLAPNSTGVQDVALQAVRSISGQVLLRAGGAGSAARPVAGAGIALAGRVATTDGQGRFVLRNLPAGHWVLEMVAVSPPPDGVKMPSAPVVLPREPVQAQGAAIVISNPGLLKYLEPPRPQAAAAGPPPEQPSRP